MLFFFLVEKPGPAENAPVIQIVRSDSTGEDDGIYSDEDSFGTVNLTYLKYDYNIKKITFFYESKFMKYLCILMNS